MSPTEVPAGRLAGEQNPFVRYRRRLDCYEAVRDHRLSDARFVEIVQKLDERIAAIDGSGFAVTPIIDGAALVADVASHLRLAVKVDVENVAGSHKARHLFGVALHLVIGAELGTPAPERLAIASCGNAALAAGVIARALDRPLEVFVPTWADELVLERLAELGSEVTRCYRRHGEVGDPAYLRFVDAIAAGASPFSVTGTDTATTFDGGRTIGWEIEEQVGMPDSAFVQVGGGALATSVAMGLPSARLYPVQASGCAPLEQAWRRLEPAFDFAEASARPDDYMSPWPNPESLASGIVDDLTHDWLPVLTLTRASGGHPIVAAEATIRSAWQLATYETDVSVSATGTAGLAGLLTEPPSRPEHVVVIFTGVERA